MEKTRVATKPITHLTFRMKPYDTDQLVVKVRQKRLFQYVEVAQRLGERMGVVDLST
jgi:hypothetical protein